jgi:hypothetical protein
MMDLRCQFNIIVIKTHSVSFLSHQASTYILYMKELVPPRKGVSFLVFRGCSEVKVKRGNIYFRGSLKTVGTDDL